LGVFGIGGLTRSARWQDSKRDQTVGWIIVTLVGLTAASACCNFAVIITLFTSALIYVFDTRPPYRIRVEGIARDRADRCTEVLSRAF